ncbi:MAG: hypothetical protein EAZ99_12010 [Alphaproteobacteria bacterium]|nr:hypothetical protein [Alphaproteobacteria bacterium]TAD88868.1 MAG: hypothetical protein EAZ99_12010 [Alphaproteobacteria bacterium]
MSRHLLALVVAGGILATPATACSPEELDQLMSSVCLEAIGASRVLLADHSARLAEPQLLGLQRQLADATHACEADNDQLTAAAAAVRVAFAMGRIVGPAVSQE